MDRTALEYTPNHKDTTEQDVEDDSPPKELSKFWRREDAEVEEEDGQLQQEDLREIKNFHDVEETKIVRDILGRYSPDVPPKSIRGQSMGFKYGTRYA